MACCGGKVKKVVSKPKVSGAKKNTKNVSFTINGIKVTTK